jgi:hypothetical protein
MVQQALSALLQPTMAEALVEAARRGAVGEVRRLLDEGADIEGRGLRHRAI